MNEKLVVMIGAAAMLCVTAGVAQAEPGWCKRQISANGRANIGEAGNPGPLACSRAKSRWAAKVRTSCPSRSPWWFRARAKSQDIDAGAGQRRCTVRAIPARKIFSIKG